MSTSCCGLWQWFVVVFGSWLLGLWLLAVGCWSEKGNCETIRRKESQFRSDVTCFLSAGSSKGQHIGQHNAAQHSTTHHIMIITMLSISRCRVSTASAATNASKTRTLRPLLSTSVTTLLSMHTQRRYVHTTTGTTTPATPPAAAMAAVAVGDAPAHTHRRRYTPLQRVGTTWHISRQTLLVDALFANGGPLLAPVRASTAAARVEAAVTGSRGFGFKW
jgi:hypothetical protein